jgi:hypothetical protein
MPNCCNGCIDSEYTNNWGITRCAFKSLRVRSFVFDDESPCNSPFSPPVGINWIDFFPVSNYKINSGSSQIEDNDATISVICDRPQNMNVILAGKKLSLIDIKNQNILCSGKINGFDMISGTDCEISIKLIRNPYPFDTIFVRVDVLA